MRTGVRLEAAGQVGTVVLGAEELVVVLAPTAVAATAMGPGGVTPPPKKGSLTGRPAKPRAKDKDPENLRSVQRENESARVLADNGYDIEQNPPSNSYNKNPDHKLNGEYADCYAPSTSDAYSIIQRIAGKVNTRQASRIVLNLDDSQVALEVLKKEILENPIAGLKDIIVIRDGKIILFHP